MFVSRDTKYKKSLKRFMAPSLKSIPSASCALFCSYGEQIILQINYRAITCLKQDRSVRLTLKYTSRCCCCCCRSMGEEVALFFEVSRTQLLSPCRVPEIGMRVSVESIVVCRSHPIGVMDKVSGVLMASICLSSYLLACSSD